MAQYDNPFTGTPLGWDDGESGWGQPLNSTLLQSAFYHNRNIDGVLTTVASLPVSPANGDAYLVEENLRVYFRSNDAWSYSVPPDNMVFTVKTTGVKYKKDGAAFVVDASGGFSGDAAEITSGTLAAARTPAFTGDVTKPEGSGVQTLTATGVGAATYGSSTQIPVISFDVKGRATSASNVSIPDATASVKGLMTSTAMAKLDGIASGAEVNVNADWNSVSGDSQILNKPTLGTAAAATLTTTTTDDTLGRVLRVGDFGLGKTAIFLSQANLDSTTSRATGLYAVNPYSSGIVNTATNSIVWHLDISANYAAQWMHVLPTVAGGDDGHVYYRDRTGAVWAPWKEVWTSNTQIALGTTAVSAKTALALNNVDNTSDSVKNSAVATLTNKTISGASNTLTNIAQSSVTSLVSDLALKAPLAAPTFTGTVVLPTTTSIGSVTSAEIGYLSGVSSNIQTQLNNKQPLATVLTNTTASFTTALETKLNGIATGAEVNVNADWNSVSGDSQILNKPTLGTAAAATLTTSTTDTTIGRVLRVGDWGLGDLSNASSDWDAITDTGFYHNTTGSETGIPAAVVKISLFHTQIDSVTATQLAMRSNSDQMWYRRKASGVWQSWTEIWTGSNLTKTTSNTDATSGRVLTVGNFGLGGTAQNVADLTSTEVNVARIFRILSGATGGSGVNGGVISLPYDGTPSTTFLQVGTNGRLYAGWKNGSAATPSWVPALNDLDKTTSATDTTSGRLWRTNDLVKVSSSTDTTSGSVLTVGYQGLGGSAIPVSDLNNLGSGVFFRSASNAVTNKPAEVSWFVGFQSSYSGSNEQAQIVVGTSGDTGMYYRSRYSGTPDTYNPWHKVWDDGNLVKTTSNTDNTTGSMLRNGDWGVGGRASLSAADLNTLTSTYNRCGLPQIINDSGAANKPSWGTYFYIQQFAYSTNKFTQIAWPYRDSDGAMGYRTTFDNITWSAWRQVYDTGNTSTDVQTMLGSADNTAIRTNIGVVSATTSVAGLVQLNNTTSSTSTTQAATANAVKTVADSVTTLKNTPSQKFQSVTASATTTITASSGTHILLSLGTNITTLNLPSPVSTEAHALVFEITATGSRSIAWPAGSIYPNGTAPEIIADGITRVLATKAGTNNWLISEAGKGWA